MDTPSTLAADMLRAAAGAAVGARAVVAKGALNVKKGAQENVAKSAPVHNAHAGSAISYDLDTSGLGAEIGYDKDKRGGALGNLLEYGSRKNAPHRDLGRALDDEEKRFEAAMDALVGKLL